LSTALILIGASADALWAIRFYEAHGYRMVSHVEKDRLLRTYWKVPERQIDTPVVLADPLWLSRLPDSTSAKTNAQSEALAPGIPPLTASPERVVSRNSNTSSSRALCIEVAGA
jgi:hypothetical protein